MGNLTIPISRRFLQCRDVNFATVVATVTLSTSRHEFALQYANFTALQVLDLSENEFNSELPKWLFNLNCSISVLDFSSSSLKGPLPKALSNFRQLEFLNLEDNNLDGPIPYWLGKFQVLQVLTLGINMFSGSIPTSLGNLSSLVYLVVTSYHLSGIVSEKNFVKLSKLKSLGIFSSPPLTFDFDSHWIPPFQLEELDISFTGPNIPEWLYTQRSIERLSIRESSFEAPGKFWNFV
ncbi:hypothetical protein Fmac_018776 [Flemingia macrophylla]|uniref:Disease resistance R13L4/SHOC-2-like LRR domain-containing protein n=1 Tax=Flemingia macrophylla TaxID=520843 RepID=A0ABD1M635_9FABA